jgi:hypothetical protein
MRGGTDMEVPDSMDPAHRLFIFIFIFIFYLTPQGFPKML